MRAWQVRELGEPRDVLTLAEVPDPEPGPGQVLVRVLGAAANFPDVLMGRGELPGPAAAAVYARRRAVRRGRDGRRRGDRVRARRPGDRRRRRCPPAAFAEMAADGRAQHAARARRPRRRRGGRLLHRLPDRLVRAAPAGARCGRRDAARPRGGRRRRQRARSSSARRPALGSSASVGGPKKAEVARELGADVVVDRRSQDFVEVVKEVTGGRGADVVYDPVGGEAYARSTKCIAFEGRILVVGFAGGTIPSAALNHALIKNYSIVGLHWGLYQTKRPAAHRRVPPAAHQAGRRGRDPAAGRRAGRAGGGARRPAAAGRRRHCRPGCRHALT